ncbi:MAG: glycosyltransferase family 2 protein [Smithella sp.]|jgi:glycosyltransferase involved in cell wall biosynthesis
MIGKLPQPPSGKTGWPWTEEAIPLSPLMPNGKHWPKISIVTPSYNQGQFLEETIRAVLLQNYHNLEYIIMDGGSTDNSIEIIKKYEPWLTYWVSEKDNGQSDAIYRGFELSTGEIIAYINSDDFYLPQAFQFVSKHFVKNSAADFLIGSCYHINSAGEVIRKYYGFRQNVESMLSLGMQYSQPACFWLRNAFFSVNGFDRAMRFCFDADLFLKLTSKKKPSYTLRTLAVFRRHSLSKSSTIAEIANAEGLLLGEKYGFHKLAPNTRISMKKKFYFKLLLMRALGIAYDLFFDTKWFLKSLRPNVLLSRIIFYKK